MKSALKLAQEYDWSSEVEYWDYIIESHINGQFTQVKNLYNAMDMRSRQEFILYLVYDSNYSESKKLHEYIGENC